MAEDVTLRFRTKGVGRAVAAFDKLERNAEDLRRVGQKMQDVGQGLTMGLTLPLGAAAAASVKLASDAQETENLFNSAMGSMTKEANAFVQQWTEATELDPITTRKRLATFQLMISNMGVASDRALQMSEDLTKLTVDLASLRNVSFEQAFTKLQSGLSGEMEALRRWGIIVGQAKIEQVALREGIIEAGEEMSQQEKVVARYLAIMNQTNTEQGDFIETQDQLANSLRTLKDQVKVAARDIGRDLIPVVEDAVQVAKDLVQSFADMDAETRRTLITVGALAAAFGPLLAALGSLTQFLAFAPGAFSTLATILGGLASGPAAALVAVLAGGSGLVWAFSQIDSAAEGARESIEKWKQSLPEDQRVSESALAALKESRQTLVERGRRVAGDLQTLREAGASDRLIAGKEAALESIRDQTSVLNREITRMEQKIGTGLAATFGGEGGAAGEAGEEAGRQMAKGMHDGLIGALFGGEFDIASVFERQARRARRAFVESTGFQTIPEMPLWKRAQTTTAGTGGVQQAAEGLPAGEMVKTMKDFNKVMAEFVDVQLEEGTDKLKRAGETTIAAFGSMAQAAIRGSDQMATSLINGISQIVQSIPGVGGLASAAVGAGAGILSAIVGGGSDNRPQPVEVTNDAVPVEEQNPRRPLDVVIQAIDAADPAQLEHNLRRRTRRDATERIPQGTSLAGGT